ncbi:MAG: DsbC family protein [Desulfuromonadaceae bacterium]|nr:DsbC family protein [Desulfuromonadaceae bacterium]MDD5105305.1 DsbC family protein [Desulfuromonadaceae bacterium]
MLKSLLICLFVSLIVSSPSFAMAKEGCGGVCSSCHSLTEKEATELLKKTGVTVASVKHSPARGLFELLVEKEGQKGILLLDYGKKHLIQGMVVDLEKLEPVSSHEQKATQPKQKTSADVTTIPAQHAVVMGNPKGAKKLYVFTDPDCPYCRKGHVELQKLAKIAPDVAIHIMLFPLPMHPAAYDKSRTVLETKDLDLLDKAFEGKDIPKPTKESSKKAIDEIVKFATANGISGTPTMVMPDGTIQVGMRDAETMKKMLEGK